MSFNQLRQTNEEEKEEEEEEEEEEGEIFIWDNIHLRVVPSGTNV